MNSADPQRIRFGGSFQLDFAAGRLYRNGLKIRLPEQSYQVLALLVKRPGNIVPREQLKQTLWPAATFGDFEHGVNKAVNRLRQALCDSAAHPRYVETVRGRGYRFIAPVPSHAQHSRDSKCQLKLMVFPFAELGKSSEHGFAGGLTEELTVTLGQAHPEMLVVGALRTAAGGTSGAGNVSEITAELNLSHWLEGSVRHYGDRVRISARLIEATAQTQLWAESYDRPVRDVLAVQSETARIISQSVAFRLLPEEWRQDARGPFQTCAPGMRTQAVGAALRPV
jgi:TolB-like protein